MPAPPDFEIPVEIRRSSFLSGAPSTAPVSMRHFVKPSGIMFRVFVFFQEIAAVVH
jgi:hypothetical protein